METMETKAKKTNELLSDAKDLLTNIQAYKIKRPTEYQSLTMSLTSVCSQLNQLDMKEITGETEAESMLVDPTK